MVSLAPPLNSPRSRSPRVEILGVFGSGKSTLAAKIASASALQHLPEDHSKNPFWGDSQAIDLAGHLPYDLAFMVQHVHLASSTAKPGSTGGICDWSFLTDRLWASMRLTDDRVVYNAVQDAVLVRIGAACGYLYLRQPANVIVDRLRGRGRKPEAEFVAFVEQAVVGVEALAQQIPGHKLQIVGDDDVNVALSRIGDWIV